MTKTNSPQSQLLTRTVRFSINPDGSMQGINGFASKPSISGFGHFCQLQVTIVGLPHPQHGYIIGIQEIDTIVRSHLLPALSYQIESSPTIFPGIALHALWDIAKSKLHQLDPDLTLFGLKWNLSPYNALEMTQAEHATNTVLIKERYEFAAAHRLHSPSMTDQENAQFFGKCNNPNGHGHNYQIEPCIRVPIDTFETLKLHELIQSAVQSTLLDPLDHKYLNIDCVWFNQSVGGVIPSVENITRVCFEQLAPVINALANGVELVSMQVWETEKTSSIYPAPAH